MLGVGVSINRKCHYYTQNALSTYCYLWWLTIISDSFYTHNWTLFSSVPRNTREFVSYLARFKTATAIQFTNKKFISYAKFFFWHPYWRFLLLLLLLLLPPLLLYGYISEPDFMRNRIYLLRNGVRSVHKTMPIPIDSDRSFLFIIWISFRLLFFPSVNCLVYLDRGKVRERERESVQWSVSHCSTLMSHRDLTFNKNRDMHIVNGIQSHMMKMCKMYCHFSLLIAISDTKNIHGMFLFCLFFPVFLILSQFLVWSVAWVDVLDVCAPHFMLHFYCYVWLLYFLDISMEKHFLFFHRKQKSFRHRFIHKYDIRDIRIMDQISNCVIIIFILEKLKEKLFIFGFRSNNITNRSGYWNWSEKYFMDFCGLVWR